MALVLGWGFGDEDMTEIKYFVSYWIQNGHGRCDIINDKPISTIKDIEDIEKAISAKAGEKVLIKSWQRFEDY